ncbi:MAG: peroxide stress protein YaaA [Flavobacteriia bacterium]|jgi:cytoplasmic iron level regulating protein YaaA (DUF328/UPF0246 family)
MKILISPAKSIQTNVSFPQVDTKIAPFLKEAESLVKKLKKYKPKKLVDLYHVSQDIAELNYNRFLNWKSPIELSEEIIPAVFAFSGEVYRGLDVKTLQENELNYLNSNLRILSGLYGILNPFDLFHPYRLEMGTHFEVSPKAKNLYQFWGDKLTNYINAEEKELVVNLASNEYFKAINTKKLKAKLVTPVFKEFKNGEYKIIAIFAKHARGEMTRFCAEKNVTTAEELKLFSYSNYQFMSEMSSDSEYVFVR